MATKNPVKPATFRHGSVFYWICSIYSLLLVSGNSSQATVEEHGA